MSGWDSRKLNSVDIKLDFEIDPRNGQQELATFGYYFSKDGRCLSLKDNSRVGRFPSQQSYENFGAALERFIFFLFRTRYKMKEIRINAGDDKDDDKDIYPQEKNMTNNKKPFAPGEISAEILAAATTKSNTNTNSNEAEDDTATKPSAKKKSKKKKKKKKSNSSDKVAKSRIYLSPDYYTKETLLILIPGSGAVRAGQWARSICINDNLAAGCMYPFVAAAYQRDWGVVLPDPNGRTSAGYIFSDSHVVYVFDNYVAPHLRAKDCAIKTVLIVCHSAGGMAASYLMRDRIDDLRNRLVAVAGTDTFFSSPGNKYSKWLFQHSLINWVTSVQPCNKPLSQSMFRSGIKRRSAGHTSHEYTSAAAFKSIFEWFDQQVAKYSDVKLRGVRGKVKVEVEVELEESNTNNDGDDLDDIENKDNVESKQNEKMVVEEVEEVEEVEDEQDEDQQDQECDQNQNVSIKDETENEPGPEEEPDLKENENDQDQNQNKSEKQQQQTGKKVDQMKVD